MLAWPGCGAAVFTYFKPNWGDFCSVATRRIRPPAAALCRRIRSAQLWASSDPTAAACSWHGTLSICRAESPPTTGKLTPLKKEQFISVLGAVPKVNSLGGCWPWVRGSGMGKVWLKVGHGMCSEGWRALPAPGLACGTARSLDRPCWGGGGCAHLQPHRSMKGAAK